MNAPKTIEEARNLREVSSLLDGDVVLKFLGGGIAGDSICLFVDSDGVSKAVDCIRETIDGPDEWVKVPL